MGFTYCRGPVENPIMRSSLSVERVMRLKSWQTGMVGALYVRLSSGFDKSGNYGKGE